MKNYLDLKKLDFKCIKCGNCCYNALRQMGIGVYGYNFRGELTYNPQVSVTIPYTEVPELRENLYNQYNLGLKVYPEYVLFMKDFPVGFIVQYQMGVKKKKFCRYYDIQKRECKIYSIRPSTCRAYPLTANPENPTFPTIESTCKGISKAIEKQFPNMREGEPYQINNFEMIQAFFHEFLTFQVIHEFILSQIELILSNLGFLFLDSYMITPEKIEGYELIDFSQFFRWVKTHVQDKNIIQILKQVQLKFDQLRLETARNISSWKNNPDQIHVPIRFWDNQEL